MILLSSLVQQFLRWNELHRAAKTVTYYRIQLGKAIGLLGDLPADELDAKHLLFLPKSWHLIQAMQRLFRWAKKEAKLIKKNPIRKLEKPKLGMRRRVLTRAEQLKLLRRAYPALRRFLLGLRESSARPQELRAVEWEDLRVDPQATSLEQSLASGLAWFELLEYKARERRSDPGTPRIIPISPRLGRLLLRQLREAVVAAGPVFLNRLAKSWRKNTLVCALRRLRKAVGLALPPRGGREQICCYTWRHSKATEMAEKGLPTLTLKSLLGHADVATTQRYVHQSTKALLQQWKDLHAKRKNGG